MIFAENTNHRNEQWPREYAAAIIALTTRAERRRALLLVPERFRDWVQFLVEDEFRKRRHAKRKKQGDRRRA
jgi:hypothetical protein